MDLPGYAPSPPDGHPSAGDTGQAIDLDLGNPDDFAREILSDAGAEPEPEPEPETGMHVHDRPIPFVRSVAESVSLRQLPPLSVSPDTDAENRHLFNNYAKRGKLPPPEARAQLIQHMQRLKVNACVAQKFAEAHQYQCLLAKFREEVEEQDVKERNAQRIGTLNAQLRETAARIAALQKEIVQKQKDTVAQQKDQRAALIRQQQDEIAAFVDHWNDRNHLRKYAKPSGYLLEVKKTERAMCLTKMFDQADVFRRRVRELEKKESELARARAFEEMEKERDKLLAKHQTELEHFDIHAARCLENVKREQEVARAAIEARQSKLASELDQWTLNPATALPPMAASIIPKAAMTPRTAKRYSAFKKVAKLPVITVQPLGNVKPPKWRRSRTSESL
jgi:TolA-binding protein